MALIAQYDNNGTLTLGAQGALDVLSTNTKIDGARKQGFRVTKSNWFFQATGKTATEGPIIIGIACNADAAEIEAAIEADPQAPSDDDSRGMGVYIKPLFLMGIAQTEFPAAGDAVMKPFTVSYGKNGWSIPEDQALTVWAYAMGALTTGTVIRFFAEHFGVWLRD